MYWFTLSISMTAVCDGVVGSVGFSFFAMLEVWFVYFLLYNLYLPLWSF